VTRTRTVAEAAARLLGTRVLSSTALAGGQMESVLALDLGDGRRVVAKGGPAPRVEAAMLAALSAAGAPTPAVVAVDDDVLVLEPLPALGTLSDAWEHLGAVLAGLHGASGAHYGWDTDYAFGPLAIPNAPSGDWPAFWAERRLTVHMHRLPRDLARRVDALAADLPNRLPRRPRPALLHGDLWGGNVLVDGGRVTGLIDPAASFGHAEVDLAMLSLFDAPGAAFAAAYGPLEPGAEARRPIYALWHAIVHVALFGEAYRPLVARLLRASGV
jgi:fructosamine-3-kinase